MLYLCLYLVDNIALCFVTTIIIYYYKYVRIISFEVCSFLNIQTTKIKYISYSQFTTRKGHPPVKTIWLEKELFKLHSWLKKKKLIREKEKHLLCRTVLCIF